MSFEAMFGHRGAGGPAERFAGERNAQSVPLTTTSANSNRILCLH